MPVVDGLTGRTGPGDCTHRGCGFCGWAAALGLYRELGYPASHDPMHVSAGTSRELARGYVPGISQTFSDELTRDVSGPPGHDVSCYYQLTWV
jgi:hypothetical protein